MQYELIDIGLNLTHSSFKKDWPQVLQQANDVGVAQMILTGSDVQDSNQAYELTKESHPGVLFSTSGVHPHNAKSCNQDTIKQLRDLSLHEEVVAIGECGLDYNRDFSPREVQRKWFTAQLELAVERQMPVFLHERDAHHDFFSILKEFHKHIPNAVVHCFTGEKSSLEAYISLGCYIGITGWICDERRGHHLRELVPLIPKNRLMLETDAPYLMPRDLKPRPKDRRNVPANLPHILETVAKCLERPALDVAQETTQNARTFFELN